MWVICFFSLAHIWVIFGSSVCSLFLGGYDLQKSVQIRRPENASMGSQPLVRPPSGDSMVCHRISDLLSRWSFLFYSVPGVGCINSNIWPTKKQQGGGSPGTKTDQLLNPTSGHGNPIWPIIGSIIEPHFGPREKHNIWTTKYNIGQNKKQAGVFPNGGQKRPRIAPHWTHHWTPLCYHVLLGFLRGLESCFFLLWVIEPNTP